MPGLDRQHPCRSNRRMATRPEGPAEKVPLFLRPKKKNSLAGARQLRPFRSLSPSLSANSEAQPSAKIRGQSRVANHLVVVLIERVFDVEGRCYARVHGIPDTHVHSRVSSRVIDIEPQEIGIRSTADEGSSEISAPAPGKIAQQHASGVLGTAYQRLPGFVKWVKRKRLRENLSRGV